MPNSGNKRAVRTRLLDRGTYAAGKALKPVSKWYEQNHICVYASLRICK